MAFSALWVQPRVLDTTCLTVIPTHFHKSGELPQFSINQKHGQRVSCFIEGPIILPTTGDLYVSDIPYGRIFKFSHEKKEWCVVLEYDGEPNGLAWHPIKQKIIIACYKTGILEFDPLTRQLQPLLTRFNGEHFKGPNDLVVGGDGSIYFTDQGMTGLQDPSGRVFRLHMNGKIDVLLKNCPSPNGLVLNKAETGLFVAMTRDNAVWYAPIYQDGTIQRTVRFSSYYGIGGPDGMTLDIEGNVFVCHSTLGKVFVHKANGEPLAIIRSIKGANTTNLTWGGKNYQTLYITESETNSILTIDWHCSGWLGEAYQGQIGAQALL